MFVRALRFFNPIAVRRYNFCTAQNPQIFEEVKAKVYKVLSSAAKCKVQNLKDDAKFEDLGFDSLDAVEMVVALEENFGYDLQNEEAERIRGVGDAIAIFYKYESEKQATAIKQ